LSKLPQRIVMATGNPGKIRELARLLDGLGVEIVAQSEFGVTDAEETGATFAENSLIKARHAAEATGLPAIADDSGLSVDALDGAPGVYSARYAGDGGDEANNDKLLAALDGVEDRGAAFHCVATYVAPGEEPLVARGEWRGEILHERSGDGGFGYDPLFLFTEEGYAASGRSFAELTPEDKAAVSHRGRALTELARRWPASIDR